jgi:hypothetical protein
MAAVAWLIAGPVAGQVHRIELLSQTARGFSAEGRSEAPAVNLNGLAAAYSSDARDLVSPPLQGNLNQMYARDLSLVTSELVSKPLVGRAGNHPSQDSGFAPGISGDGNIVVFSSSATNLVSEDTEGRENVFAYDRQEGLSSSQPRSRRARQRRQQLSQDQRRRPLRRLPVDRLQPHRRREQRAVEHLRVRPHRRGHDAGQHRRRRRVQQWQQHHAEHQCRRPHRRLCLARHQPRQPIDQRDIRTDLRDRVAGSVDRVDLRQFRRHPGNAISFLPALSADGSQIAFKSEAFNLVPNDTNGDPDVFVRDRTEGTTQRVSVDSFGNQANSLSGGPGISGDGRFVAFPSFASNLVPDDGNGFSDVYVYDRFPPNRQQGILLRVSVAMDGGEPNQGVSDFPVTISTDGRWIGFASAASNLVPNDLNNDLDAFLGCNPFDLFDCAAATPTPTDRHAGHACVAMQRRAR